jgi:hypothetical protein
MRLETGLALNVNPLYKVASGVMSGICLNTGFCALCEGMGRYMAVLTTCKRYLFVLWRIPLRLCHGWCFEDDDRIIAEAKGTGVHMGSYNHCSSTRVWYSVHVNSHRFKYSILDDERRLRRDIPL